MLRSYQIAPVGSTGNATHASQPVNEAFERLALAFKIEAAGATPTVTFSLQGSFDGPEVADGSSSWNTIVLIDASSLTGAGADAIVKTAVGTYVYFSRPESFFRKVRLVTSANTNVTYSAKLISDSKVRGG